MPQDILSPRNVPLKTALLSVSDKTGLLELAKILHAQHVRLISTGGTAQALRDGGFEVTDVAQITGFPEMMDGRVKTLHPKIHGGLLAERDNAAHIAAMQAHGIDAIDLLVVNLYPFEKTRDSCAPYQRCVENIDIGGPAMIRAAAKNHGDVCVVVDPEDYAALGVELNENTGATSHAFRAKMAQIAYARTAAYDMAIASWMADALDIAAPRREGLAAEHVMPLRYGENPHQSARFLSGGALRRGVATAKQIQGKALSYNNINDTDAAFELVSEFGGSVDCVCAIIKHANPCGVARGGSLLEAYQRAYACDKSSAFGGIVALNQCLDEETAEEIIKIFTEVVIAPGASAGAREVFARKPNLRLLLTDGLAEVTAQNGAKEQVWRQVAGGYLVQDRDTQSVSAEDLRSVTKRQPDAREIEDMLFAWKIAKHVKSNAIVYVKNGQSIGIGAGQMSRVDSARIAAHKARLMAESLEISPDEWAGAVVASDAFFPFADGLLEAVNLGVSAVIQPGGSMRDDEVIAAANDAGLAMALTGVRHFRH